jgi:hypothetical protein
MLTLYRMRARTYKHRRSMKRRSRRNRRNRRNRPAQAGGQRAPLTKPWGGMLVADDRNTVVFRRPDPTDPTSVPMAMNLRKAIEIAREA